MGRHTGAWKAHERRTAQRLGGQRLGATGTANPDVVSGWLAVECKHREKLPQWLTSALAQVRAQAQASQLGIVVLHEQGARDALVLLSLADFIAWFGSAGLQQDMAQAPHNSNGTQPT